MATMMQVRPAYVPDAISSTLSQSFGDIELIIVDDGSFPKIEDIVGASAFHDPRLMIIRQENRGVAAARNLGLLSAKG